MGAPRSVALFVTSRRWPNVIASVRALNAQPSIEAFAAS